MRADITVFVLLTFTIVGCVNGPAIGTPASFAAAYSRANSEAKKRSVCIEVVDAGLIRMGARIELVKTIFSRDFNDHGVDSRGNKLGIVFFVPPIRSTNSLVSDFVRGWYLTLTYAPDGVILDYYLSNFGKESSMRTSATNVLEGEIGLPVIRP